MREWLSPPELQPARKFVVPECVAQPAPANNSDSAAGAGWRESLVRSCRLLLKCLALVGNVFAWFFLASFWIRRNRTRSILSAASLRHRHGACSAPRADGFWSVSAVIIPRARLVPRSPLAPALQPGQSPSPPRPHSCFACASSQNRFHAVDNSDILMSLVVSPKSCPVCIGLFAPANTLARSSCFCSRNPYFSTQLKEIIHGS